MTMTKVKSSNIHSIGYDPATLTMRVQFRGGKVRQYSGVPAESHQSFLHSESIGGHFAAHIRGRYNGQPVEHP